jgi:hypothetical protein
VTAVDNAGNAVTRTVGYSVTAPAPLAAGARLLAWNDLGMHCMDTDYSVFTLLPPFNNLNAQLVVGGKLVAPDPVSPAYTLTYESTADPRTGALNTYSAGAGKSNFWDHFGALFGGALAPNMGMTGNPMATTRPARLKWVPEFNWFEATGIPITPIDDAGNFNAYPMVKVTARNASGQEIATTRAVLPVSTEMNCRECHASVTGSADASPAGGWVNAAATPTERDWRMNALRLHDEKNAGNPTYATLLAAKGYAPGLESAVAGSGGSKAIFCDTCHNRNALTVWGLGGVDAVTPMTVAMHNRHAAVKLPGTSTPLDAVGSRDACYACHPGKTTQCLRGAMGNPVDASSAKHVMECQSCHGSMKTVGRSTPKREGWLDMPTCQSCHHDAVRETNALNADGSFKIWSDKRFASNADTPQAGTSLYRFSTGHGKLQCEACHNSTHAEFTSKPSGNGSELNDNLRAIEAQGYAAALRECTACHTTPPRTVNGGPHGMHSVGAQWVEDHHDVAKGTALADCQYCHGKTSAGSPLAVIKVARTFSIDDGRRKTFAAEERVTCWSCHNGPNP